MDWVYIVECADGTWYTGWTTDPDERVATHNSGSGARYTRGRLPVRLIYREICADRGQALRREREIKKLTKKQKQRLVATAAGTAE
jgi:putative endonuclease